MTPRRIGTILIMPLPQILQMTTMTIATSATHQQLSTLLIAEGARLRPIEMMIGPVTIGGKYFITLLVPYALKSAASRRYRIPAQATPRQA